MKKKPMPFTLYNALLCLAAVVITVMVCLVAREAEKKWYLKWDVSESRLSRLSDYTMDRLAALDEEVTLSLVYPAGAEDALRDLQLETLGRMAAACPKVRVEELDPLTQPQRIAQLAGDVSGVRNGTVFVANEEKNRVIRLEPDGFLFSRRIGQKIYTIYGGEAQLIGAVERACMDTPLAAWFLTGHGELGQEDCQAFALQLRALGFDVREGTLNGIQPAPNDVLLLLAPTEDLTAAEADRLVEFLDGGGRLIVACGADAPFDRLGEMQAALDVYGLGYHPGWAVENPAETACYQDRPEWLQPLLCEENGLMEELPGRLILPRSAAVSVPALRPGVTAAALLKTSGRAVLRADPAADPLSSSTADQSGTLLLAVMAEKDDMRILQLASSDMLRDGAETTGAAVVDASENLRFLAACMAEMTDLDGTATLEAGVKQLPAQLITFENQQVRLWVSAVILAALPCLIAIIMAAVLIGRRRL